MQLVKKEKINKQKCWDITVQKNSNFFANRVLVHNSNGAVRINPKDGSWVAQSRERELTPMRDNHGFYDFVDRNIDAFRKMAQYYDLWDEVVFYGEWCGGSIQKGVALSQLEKMFVIFSIRLRDGEDWTWIEPSLSEYPENKIYSIRRIPEWNIVVDLNYPEMAIDKMVKITEEIENECPFAKSFGVSGIGEGAVYCHEDDFSIAFKVKGDKHSKSKVKKLPTVDIEKVKGVEEFIERHLTNERFEQAWMATSEDQGHLDMKKMGDFIRWINNDIWEEEKDEAFENNIERSIFGKRLPPKCVAWFKNKLYES